MEYQSEGIGKLAAALSKAQSQMNGVSKGADNPFFKSKYADLYQCIEAAQKPLTDNELAVIQTTRTSADGIVIITTLAHSSGEWIRGELSMKPKKDDDQGRGSSITYGRRYAYAAIIGLAQKDDDGNAACQNKQQANKPKPKPVNWYIDDARKNADELTAWWKDYGQEVEQLQPKDKTTIMAELTKLKNQQADKAKEGA